MAPIQKGGDCDRDVEKLYDAKTHLYTVRSSTYGYGVLDNISVTVLQVGTVAAPAPRKNNPVIRVASCSSVIFCIKVSRGLPH